jgi:hypothetical protein
MTAMEGARSPVAQTWLLLAALALLSLVGLAELGAGARPFEPPSVEPVGPLAFLVDAAGLDWSPPLLRAAAAIAALLVACAAGVLALRPRPWSRWAPIALSAVVVVLLTVPGVALQAGLRQATAPWFHTNDSTFQIELGGELIRDGLSPYGHDYRRSGMERVYPLDGRATDRARERQVALQHFAYFPGTPLSAAAWGVLPAPWSDYRFLVLLSTLAGGALALALRGPLAWRLALGALIAANPIAVRSGWFGQADAPALALTILSFVLAARSRWTWAALALAAAILLKQFALFALPFLALAAWQRAEHRALVRAGAALAAVVVLGFLPFLIADPGAVWKDTVTYGGSIYPIVGYGLAGLLAKAGVIGIDDPWPFAVLAIAIWLPATLLLLRAQARSGALWMAAAGFAASLYLAFFVSRVFQETYAIWPLTAVALAGLLAIHERAAEPAADRAAPETEPERA